MVQEIRGSNPSHGNGDIQVDPWARSFTLHAHSNPRERGYMLRMGEEWMLRNLKLLERYKLPMTRKLNDKEMHGGFQP